MIILKYPNSEKSVRLHTPLNSAFFMHYPMSQFSVLAGLET